MTTSPLALSAPAVALFGIACSSDPIRVRHIQMPKELRECFGELPTTPATAFHARLCATVGDCVLEASLNQSSAVALDDWTFTCPTMTSTAQFSERDGLRARFYIVEDLPNATPLACDDRAALEAECARTNACIDVTYRTVDIDKGTLTDPRVPHTSTSAFDQSCSQISCRALDVAGRRAAGPRCSFCDNGIREANEACDDQRVGSGHGCATGCVIEAGWTCADDAGGLSICQSCGDGMVQGTETCDNGDVLGCRGCVVEPKWRCDIEVEPSLCWSCNDGAIQRPVEKCDHGEGCAPDCLGPTSSAWICDGQPTCRPDCGDARKVGGETCDPGRAGDWRGCDRETCHAATGWSCAEGRACEEICGDALRVGREACDDHNRRDDDGCSAACGVEPGWECPRVGTACNRICGNGVVNMGETCDDGGTANDDGCSETCALETGWECPRVGTACNRICGNGTVNTGETCDDGNRTSGDGCGAACGLESGWECPQAGVACRRLCGNGTVNAPETCDDGNRASTDGCSATCVLEAGWECPQPGLACNRLCGNGTVNAPETCDDGGTADNDGCSASCRLEPNWTCSNGSCSCSLGTGEPFVSSETMPISLMSTTIDVRGHMSAGGDDYFSWSFTPPSNGLAQASVAPPQDEDYDMCVRFLVNGVGPQYTCRKSTIVPGTSTSATRDIDGWCCAELSADYTDTVYLSNLPGNAGTLQMRVYYPDLTPLPPNVCGEYRLTARGGR